MDDSYAGLSGHYDMVMASGYYDYDAYAKAILTLVGERRRLVEVGVGTGLACERVLALGDAEVRLTGIDPSESMLAQARKRLGGRVELVCQDVLHLNLPDKFDAAFCVGGVWGYTRGENGVHWCSLLLTDDENARAFAALRNCLNPGGLLLLAVQGPHADSRRQLPDGLVYTQKVDEKADGRLVKDYWITNGAEVVAHQQSRIKVSGERQAQIFLAQCGFELVRDSDTRLFYQFVRT